jgi:hypothetical protein
MGCYKKPGNITRRGITGFEYGMTIDDEFRSIRGSKTLFTLMGGNGGDTDDMLKRVGVKKSRDSSLRSG